jgi:hypothetical protein
MPTTATQTKLLVLKCSSNDENFDGGCEYALIEITPAFCKLALDRIALCDRLHQEDVSLVEMYYWNYDALYFGRHGDSDLGDNAATDIEECAPKLAELLDTTIDDWDNDDEQAELTADLFVPESLQCRVECTQMVIGHDGYVHMFCYPKHTSVQITTNYLSKKQLQEYLEAFNA